MLFEVSLDQTKHLLSQPNNIISDALEEGRIVHFPSCPITLPSDEELTLLRDRLGEHLSRKNVSWYPSGDRLVGLQGDVGLRERVRAILRGHAEHVSKLLRGLMPSFMAGALSGTTSFRPLQERGRQLSAHASNELIHVDAGAYGATRGARILRFFVNVNPAEERVWASKGTFEELLQLHGRKAGLITENRIANRLEPGKAERAFSGALALGAKVWPSLRMVDTSPYDRLMRRFHNYMKDDPAFRDSRDGWVEYSFKPFSAWMVLTDGVSHACLSGQHALVDTFLVPLQNCRLKAKTPFALLAAG
jgi:hypothetical protein